MNAYSRLDRPIVVVDYNPRWLALFESERERLTFLLGGRSVDIQHIGSTSIPGLAAKPVIDIAIGFQELPTADSCIHFLESVGYTYEPDLEAALPDRRFLWRVDPSGQRYHLHLADIHSRLWSAPLLSAITCAAIQRQPVNTCSSRKHWPKDVAPILARMSTAKLASLKRC